MPFGVTAKQKKTEQVKVTYDPIFLSLSGERLVRFLGDEIQVKRHFIEVNVGDNKRGKRPITIAVSVLDDDGEMYFVGNDDNGTEYWDNPIDNMYRDQYTKEEIQKQGLYPQTRFYVNVLHRTPVLKTSEGTILYPEIYLDEEGNVKSEFANLGEPVPHELIMILEQSSGKPGGDHFFNKIVNAAKSLKSRRGRKISIEERDFRITYNLSDRVWNGKKLADRQIWPDVNEEPVVYTEEDLYDLKSWCRPWPNEAIQEVLDGAVYSEVMEKYKIPFYPSKGKRIESDDNLPF